MAVTSCLCSPRASPRPTTKSSSTPHREAGPSASAIGSSPQCANGTGEQDDENPAPAPRKKKKAPGRNQPPQVELFNLAQDLSEKHNLASENRRS